MLHTLNDTYRSFNCVQSTVVQELFQMLRHQTTCLPWGINLTQRSTLCGQVNFLSLAFFVLCFVFCFDFFEVVNCCQHVLFHLAVVVKDIDSWFWFFYAWLKVQLHLSFFFPASRPASLPTLSKLRCSWFHT